MHVESEEEANTPRTTEDVRGHLPRKVIIPSLIFKNTAISPSQTAYQALCVRDIRLRTSIMTASDFTVPLTALSEFSCGLALWDRGALAARSLWGTCPSFKEHLRNAALI